MFLNLDDFSSYTFKIKKNTSSRRSNNGDMMVFLHQKKKEKTKNFLQTKLLLHTQNIPNVCHWVWFFVASISFWFFLWDNFNFLFLFSLMFVLQFIYSFCLFLLNNFRIRMIFLSKIVFNFLFYQNWAVIAHAHQWIFCFLEIFVLFFTFIFNDSFL